MIVYESEYNKLVNELESECSGSGEAILNFLEDKGVLSLMKLEDPEDETQKEKAYCIYF